MQSVFEEIPMKRSAWVLLLIMALAMAVPQADASLISYWALDDGSGTTALNQVLTGPSAYLRSNGALPTWTTGRFNSAVQFGPDDDWADVTINVPEDTMAVSLWVRTTTADTGVTSVNNPERGGENDRNIWFSGGNINGRVWAEETITATPPSGSYTDGNWHHIVHQFGSAISGQQLWVDGVLRASGSKSFSNFNWQTHFTFGWANQGAGGGSFNGTIDDVAIFSNILTPAQIAALATGSAQPDEILVHPVAELATTGTSILGRAFIYDPALGTTTAPDSYVLEYLAGPGLWEGLANVSGVQVGDLLTMGDFGVFGLPIGDHTLRLTVYGAGTYSQVTQDYALVPEPGTLAIVATGLLALLRRRRR
jgi:hypothetical protein